MNPFFQSGRWSMVAALLSAACAQAASGAAQHEHDHDEFEQHGAHEHGKVTFNIALDGQRLVVELDSPADSVIGFEHAPRTDAEKAKVRDQSAWLKAGRNLIGLPPAAGCRFVESKVEAPEFKQDDSHADYEVSLTYHCEQPQRLEWLQLSLLSGLHGVQEARVNLATPSRQSSETVKSADARVRLR